MHAHTTGFQRATGHDDGVALLKLFPRHVQHQIFKLDGKGVRAGRRVAPVLRGLHHKVAALGTHVRVRADALKVVLDAVEELEVWVSPGGTGLGLFVRHRQGKGQPHRIRVWGGHSGGCGECAGVV